MDNSESNFNSKSVILNKPIKKNSSGSKLRKSQKSKEYMKINEKPSEDTAIKATEVRNESFEYFQNDFPIDKIEFINEINHSQYELKHDTENKEIQEIVNEYPDRFRQSKDVF